ncbi:MAG: PorT family protein [Treponema sp.]|nr:PorT family protein [Treponema sp.]
MKKIIAMFAAVVLSTTAVFADFSAGARAGVGINFFEFDDDIASFGDPKVKCGFTAAVFADIDIPVVEGLVFQPELVFARHVFALDEGVEIEITSNTLDLPLLLGYKIKAGDSFTIMPFKGCLE